MDLVLNEFNNLIDTSIIKLIKEYGHLSNKLYKNQKLSLEEAVEQAIKGCIRQGVLKEFLEKNRNEVVNMLFTEFNLEDAKEVWQEEAEERGKRLGEQEGRRLGEQKAKVELAIELLDILDVETIAKKTKLSVKEIEELKQANME